MKTWKTQMNVNQKAIIPPKIIFASVFISYFFHTSALFKTFAGHGFQTRGQKAGNDTPGQENETYQKGSEKQRILKRKL